MNRLLRAGAALLGLAAAGSIAPSQAGTLRVEPVSIEVPAPAGATALILSNDGTKPINVQIRVFRWTQAGGEDQLVATDEVVASPPAVSMTPNGKYTVRLVRVAKTPVKGEEAYRVLVDQLPEPSEAKGHTINFVVRLSIPAFFSAADVAPGSLRWSVAPKGRTLTVQASNGGDKHVRLSGLKVQDKRGKEVSFGQGLVGYVLGSSTRHWAVAAPKIGPVVQVSADTQDGALHAKPNGKAK